MVLRSFSRAPSRRLVDHGLRGYEDATELHGRKSGAEDSCIGPPPLTASSFGCSWRSRTLSQLFVIPPFPSTRILVVPIFLLLGGIGGNPLPAGHCFKWLLFENGALEWLPAEDATYHINNALALSLGVHLSAFAASITLARRFGPSWLCSVGFLVMAAGWACLGLGQRFRAVAGGFILLGVGSAWISAAFQSMGHFFASDQVELPMLALFGVAEAMGPGIPKALEMVAQLLRVRWRVAWLLSGWAAVLLMAGLASWSCLPSAITLARLPTRTVQRPSQQGMPQQHHSRSHGAHKDALQHRARFDTISHSGVTDSILAGKVRKRRRSSGTVIRSSMGGLPKDSPTVYQRTYNGETKSLIVVSSASHSFDPNEEGDISDNTTAPLLSCPPPSRCFGPIEPVIETAAAIEGNNCWLQSRLLSWMFGDARAADGNNTFDTGNKDFASFNARGPPQGRWTTAWQTFSSLTGSRCGEVAYRNYSSATPERGRPGAGYRQLVLESACRTSASGGSAEWNGGESIVRRSGSPLNVTEQYLSETASSRTHCRRQSAKSVNSSGFIRESWFSVSSGDLERGATPPPSISVRDDKAADPEPMTWGALFLEVVQPRHLLILGTLGFMQFAILERFLSGWALIGSIAQDTRVAAYYQHLFDLGLPTIPQGFHFILVVGHLQHITVGWRPLAAILFLAHFFMFLALCANLTQAVWVQLVSFACTFVAYPILKHYALVVFLYLRGRQDSAYRLLVFLSFVYRSLGCYAWILWQTYSALVHRENLFRRSQVLSALAGIAFLPIVLLYFLDPRKEHSALLVFQCVEKAEQDTQNKKDCLVRDFSFFGHRRKWIVHAAFCNRSGKKAEDGTVSHPPRIGLPGRFSAAALRNIRLLTFAVPLLAPEGLTELWFFGAAGCEHDHQLMHLGGNEGNGLPTRCPSLFFRCFFGRPEALARDGRDFSWLLAERAGDDGQPVHAAGCWCCVCARKKKAEAKTLEEPRALFAVSPSAL